MIVNEIVDLKGFKGKGDGALARNWLQAATRQLQEVHDAMRLHFTRFSRQVIQLQPKRGEVQATVQLNHQAMSGNVFIAEVVGLFFFRPLRPRMRPQMILVNGR